MFGIFNNFRDTVNLYIVMVGLITFVTFVPTRYDDKLLRNQC